MVHTILVEELSVTASSNWAALIQRHNLVRDYLQILRPTKGDISAFADRAGIEATNGVIGQLMGAVSTALREAVRDNRDAISFDDLVIAVDLWNVGHGFTQRNPLRDL